MRQLLTLMTFSTFIILTASQCKKNKPDNTVDQLPPETQTGANTFGCLVDGKIFLPKGDPLAGPIKKAQYQLINGRQGFGVSARYSDGNEGKLVGISGDSIQITVGTFDLAAVGAGQLIGGYTYSNLNTLPGIQYGTNNINHGQLVIKKFDTVNQIVSGTFWFDAKNSSGQIVQIREGRFDLPYIR